LFFFIVSAVLVQCVCGWNCTERIIGANRAVGRNFFRDGVATVSLNPIISNKSADCVEEGDLVFVAADLNCTKPVVDGRSVQLGFIDRSPLIYVTKEQVGKPHGVTVTTVASGPASDYGVIALAPNFLEGSCSVTEEGFSVSVPTVTPLQYINANSPLENMYASEKVSSKGVYTYSMDMTVPNVALKALPMVSQRRVTFEEGSYMAFESGSSIVWDHCDRLKNVPDGEHIILNFHGAKMNNSIPDLDLHCSMDGNTWEELMGLYPGDVARELPNKSCCLVRVTFEDPDPDIDHVWVMHRYSITAPVTVKAPAYDFNGGQLVFAQTISDGVSVALDHVPVFKFAPDYSYTLTFLLNSPRLVSLSVNASVENVEVETVPETININGDTTLKLKLMNFDVWAMSSGEDAKLEVKFSFDKVYAQFLVIISSEGAGDPIPPKPVSSSHQQTSSNSNEEDPNVSSSLLPSTLLVLLILLLSATIILH